MNMHSPATAAIPFQQLEAVMNALSADAAAHVIQIASDITLILDAEGVIRDMSVGSTELADLGLDEWLDRPWTSTVSSESRHKVVELLHDAAAGGSHRWREVNHDLAGGESLPIRYTALDTGEDGKVIAIGRDLRSVAALQQKLLQVQQAIERDYLKLRQTESRYRLLFQTSAEAVLIVDAGSRRVREANPAALRLLGADEQSVLGQPFSALLAESADAAAQQALSMGASNGVLVRLRSGAECVLSSSSFRQERSALHLVRLHSSEAAGESDGAGRLSAVLERISDAFVVTDPDLLILAYNPAFLDLAQLATTEQALEQPLDRFLGRPQIDLKVMLGQLREHGEIRNFETVLRGRLGALEDVEVSAVAVPDGDQPCLGFSIRGVARRLNGVGAHGGAPAPRSVEQMTQLIGRVPMKEIVRESTDLIEKLCIEAALQLTSNNRASAADILGLSRQSLYSKLHRYGLGDLDGASSG
jgi:transcriptional regulator PpsR